MQVFYFANGIVTLLYQAVNIRLFTQLIQFFANIANVESSNHTFTQIEVNSYNKMSEIYRLTRFKIITILVPLAAASWFILPCFTAAFQQGIDITQVILVILAFLPISDIFKKLN